jgi:predicted RNase H-like nuclease (RuvC/YqgF family)
MSHPTTPNGAPDTVQNHINTLKRSFATTWAGTERAVEFLAQTIRLQAQRIQSLESHAAELEKMNQEKKDLIDTLEKRLAEATTTEDQITQKERQLTECTNFNGKLQVALKHAFEGVTDLRKKVEAAEYKYQHAMAEVETLRVKMSEGARRDSNQTQGNGFSPEQLAAMEVALKKELEDRSDAGTLLFKRFKV